MAHTLLSLWDQFWPALLGSGIAFTYHHKRITVTVTDALAKSSQTQGPSNL